MGLHLTILCAHTFATARAGQGKMFSRDHRLHCTMFTFCRSNMGGRARFMLYQSLHIMLLLMNANVLLSINGKSFNPNAYLPTASLNGVRT